MPSFEEAVRIILDAVTPLEAEPVALLDSLGRVSAEDVVAPWSTPACDNSAMDGYAVRTTDCTPGAALPVVDYLPAGVGKGAVLASGTAIRIMTGAPVPANADAVIPFEAAEENAGVVRLTKSVVARQHIRFAGEDICAGEIIVPAGRTIRPVDIGAMASFGIKESKVHRQSRVAVLSTGDELVEHAEDLVPGKVLDSNRWAVAAAVRACGGIPVLLGIACDNPQSHRDKLEEGLCADVLITSAGVSAGDRDFVRDTLLALGVRQVFRGVRVKPGSPTCFSLHGKTPVFSLPGNPVATLITFEEFVKPAILKMMGHRHVVGPFVRAFLSEDVRKNAGFARLLRVSLQQHSGALWASSAGKQDTGMQKTLLRADALAFLPADRTSFAAGDEVQVQLLGYEGAAQLADAFNHAVNTSKGRSDKAGKITS